MNVLDEPAPCNHHSIQQTLLLVLFHDQGLGLARSGLLPRIHDLRHESLLRVGDQTAGLGHRLLPALRILLRIPPSEEAILHHGSARHVQRTLHCSQFRLAHLPELLQRPLVLLLELPLPVHQIHVADPGLDHLREQPPLLVPLHDQGLGRARARLLPSVHNLRHQGLLRVGNQAASLRQRLLLPLHDLLDISPIAKALLQFRPS
mmetsp:Transcript_130931/g.330572  ORF Transcript_130931/g.330572 Transcript_130931/m.330572 type:complete len:205 (+) Transcript_130931:817-1431(+)